MKNQAFASISLDLDDEWSYLKTHGEKSWTSFPSYLSLVVPRILDFLDTWNQKITFFIIGIDASFDYNRDLLKEIKLRGHEIANHSFHHDPWLKTYTEEDLKKELDLSEAIIDKVTGERPVGFRGPGFSFSGSVIRELMERDYLYDASTFPNFLSSLARHYFLRTTKLSKEERRKRKELFGGFTDGFRPNKPYWWQSGNKKLLEIPVTTMPFLKIPIHASYILYISTYNKLLAEYYFVIALKLLKIRKVNPSILLHPLDFLGKEDVTSLGFFPAMQVERSKKEEVMDMIFEKLSTSFRLVTMREHASLQIESRRVSIKAV